MGLCFYYQTKKHLDNLRNAKSKLPCHSSVKWSSPRDFLKAQFVIFRKWSSPRDFLKAQFVIFRCRKYVKKGNIEMRKRIYLVPLKSCLGRSILRYCSFLRPYFDLLMCVPLNPMEFPSQIN